MKFYELQQIISQHNKENSIKQQYADKHPLICVVVFAQSNFDKEYAVEARSYQFRSDEKYFIPEMGGNSIFADSLDGTDHIKLNYYLGDWVIEDCYIKEEK